MGSGRRGGSTGLLRVLEGSRVTMCQIDKAEQSGRPGEQCCAGEVGQNGDRDGKALEMPKAMLGLSSQPWGALQHPQQEALVWGFKETHDAHQN